MLSRSKPDAHPLNIKMSQYKYYSRVFDTICEITGQTILIHVLVFKDLKLRKYVACDLRH